MIKRMKKNILKFGCFLLFLVSPLLFTKSVNAAGQYCCNQGLFYNPSSSSDPKPCKPPATAPYVEPQEWSCYTGEVCIDTGVFSRSICSLDPNDGNPCCDSGFTYNPSQENDPEPCKPPSHSPYVAPRPWKCSGDQWCSSQGYCVTGEAESPQPHPFNLLQPKCCRIDNNMEVACSAFDPSNGAADLQYMKGIVTALGCFPTQPKAIVEWLLKYALMFAGAIGFLLMLYASFQIMTSSGDPEKLKAGQQLLAAAITGILIIVFAIFILRYIGVTILQIPGWE
jgi:hypothetical protein